MEMPSLALQGKWHLNTYGDSLLLTFLLKKSVSGLFFFFFSFSDFFSLVCEKAR